MFSITEMLLGAGFLPVIGAAIYFYQKHKSGESSQQILADAVASLAQVKGAGIADISALVAKAGYTVVLNSTGDINKIIPTSQVTALPAGGGVVQVVLPPTPTPIGSPPVGVPVPLAMPFGAPAYPNEQALKDSLAAAITASGGTYWFQVTLTTAGTMTVLNPGAAGPFAYTTQPDGTVTR